MRHLDTSTVVAYLRGSETVRDKLILHLGDLSMSSLVLAELLYGASVSARPAENLRRVREFRDQVTIVDFDEAAAEAYGKVRQSLRKKGLPTGETDALIAAVALARDSILVTHNLKHFENIDGLIVEDWVPEKGP